jgi:hypothetical protein
LGFEVQIEVGVTSSSTSRENVKREDASPTMGAGCGRGGEVVSHGLWEAGAGAECITDGARSRAL